MEELQRIKNEARKVFQQLLLDNHIDVSSHVDARQKEELAVALKRILIRLSRGYRKIVTEDILEEVKDSIIAEYLGYGVIEKYIRDPKVTDILVNSPDQIFIEKDGILIKGDVKFEDEKQITSIIERMIMESGRRVDWSSPYVDFRLKGGERVTAVIPPIASRSPSLCIRKIMRDIFSLEQLIEMGTLTPKMADFLKYCVKGRLNILISGATGTGKTTFMNLLAKEFIPVNERVIVIEDTEELVLNDNQHFVKLLTRPPNISGEGEVMLSDLVKLALHLRPDRIIIGEVRGEEAFNFLHIVNTGHDGSMCTIHSNDAEDALVRLETLSLMSRFNISKDVVHRFMRLGINLIVHMLRLTNGKRVVSQVSEFDYDGNNFIIKDIFSLQKVVRDGKEDFIAKPTGYKPSFLEELTHRVNIPQNLLET